MCSHRADNRIASPAAEQAHHAHFVVPPSASAPRPGGPGFPTEDLERPIHDRFLRIAGAYPGHIAVDTTGRSLTYAELARRARNTAAALVRACGPGPGHVVLLLSDPLETVPAILGTLMAGKTYVPLDPAYPRARLELILDDAMPQAVVVGTGARGAAAELTGRPGDGGYRVLDVAATVDRDAPAPDVVLSSDACASLLYTSGSTGRPKGVLQSHRNVLFHIRNLTDLFGISPSDRHSVTASFSFDASTSDMFSALLNGAALVPVDVLRDGLHRLGRDLLDKRVTLYHSTPTVFRHIPESADPARAFPGLRLVVLGGEPVTRQDVRLFRQWFGPGCLLVNGYGATETSGFTAMHIATEDDAEEPSAVPIGRPLPGLRLELRDKDGLEVRAEGELFVMSDHLGVGYWRDAEADRRAFGVEERDGRTYRVYRTGDIARRTPDGSLRLLGRQDRQTKIHGRRLEVSAIESALSALPNVAQTAVSVIRDPRTDTDELAAYVRPRRKDAGLDPAELRRALAGQLPGYMVPAYFSVVESLPMTPTGKVDMRALPPPTGATPAVIPGDLTPTERTVLTVWCDVLAVAAVGLDQNFFDVGGHSLLMARVHRRLEELLARRLPLHRLFEHSTIRKTARFLDGGDGDAPDDADVRDRIAQRVSRRRERRSARGPGGRG